jgi:hypothetical protein
MSLFKPNIKLSRLFSLVDLLVLATLGAIVYGLIAVGGLVSRFLTALLNFVVQTS